MSDKNNKKRILIIDDDIGTLVKPDALFRNSGVDAEVFVTRWLQKGLEKLKEWAADRHPADIVDSDYYVTTSQDIEDFYPNNRGANNGYNGVSVIGHIMKWAETQAESLRPKKYFMHSKTPDEPWHHVCEMNWKDKVDVYDTEELADIGSIGEEDGYPSNRAGSRNFREYCNKELGTRFPITDAQLKMLKEPEAAKIELYEAYYEVTNSGLAPEKALKCLDTDNLARRFRDCIDRQKAEEMGIELSYNLPGFERGIGRAMSGAIAFSAEKAAELHKQGKKAILVLEEFTPEDTKLLAVADGIILLGKGTEHLEVVVANHNIPAVMGNKGDIELQIEEKDGRKRLTNKKGRYVEADKFVYEEGEDVTIDQGGTYHDSRTDREVTSGMMIKGALPIEKRDPFIVSEEEREWRVPMYETVISWADDARAKHGGAAVKANADTPEQVQEAIRLGAEGIGLCRTEHMFFAEERLAALQKALLSDDRAEAYAKLKGFQKHDFEEIFKAASAAGRDFPITIRLLDAPPEEFLSHDQVKQLEGRVGNDNTRGIQLAAHTPGLYAMQAEAIFEAAQESEYSGKLDIMIPLIRTSEELRTIKSEIDNVAKRYKMSGRYGLRAMVETTDAVKNADLLPVN